MEGIVFIGIQGSGKSSFFKERFFPIVRKLAEKCEPPTWLEGHDLTFVGGG